MTEVRIEQVDWSSRKEQLLGIRYQVFVEEQGVPHELEHDTHDADAIHLLAINPTGDAIATARLLADGHIGRMAVLAQWRNRGIGMTLLRRLLDITTSLRLSGAFLHAQCGAVPFYERLGFVAEGPVFKDAGIDHQCMRITLQPKSG